MRLGSIYRTRGETDLAISTLETALGANQGERKLHYTYAKLLFETGKGTSDAMLYHLKRGFTPGDRNYDAQVLYGRQLFLTGEFITTKEVFRSLNAAKVSPETKNTILYPLDPIFHGRVVRNEATYCFIARDGTQDWIYAHSKNVAREVWVKMTTGARVAFRIGFTFKGASAFALALDAS
jgi:cold shock CspA family protein